MPLQEFLALFPAGQYRFTDATVEGETLEAVATFTHYIPDGPSIVAPERRAVLDPKKAIIRWDPVTTPAGIQISGYQVIVEGGTPLRVLSIDLPATATSVKISAEFLEPDTNYQFEILAKEAGGNQNHFAKSLQYSVNPKMMRGEQPAFQENERAALAASFKVFITWRYGYGP